MKFFSSILLMLFSLQFAVSQSVVAYTGIVADDLESPASIEYDGSASFFHLVGGLIVINGQIDGVDGKYILDTGASDLVINKPVNAGQSVATGLNGDITAEEITIKSFKLGGFEAKEVNAFQTDLSVLEKGSSLSIAGLVGHSLIDQQALHINYQAQEFKLEEAPKKKEMLSAGWEVFSLAEFGHLLAVKVKMDGKTYWMGLDTGAEVNIISDQFSNELTPNRNSCQKICGLGDKTISLPQISTPIARVGDLSFHTINSFLSPFSNVQDQVGKGLDGLLGFPFFEQFEVVLDYSNNRLYLR